MGQGKLGAQEAEDVAAHLGRLAGRERLRQGHVDELGWMLRNSTLARNMAVLADYVYMTGELTYALVGHYRLTWRRL